MDNLPNNNTDTNNKYNHQILIALNRRQRSVFDISNELKISPVVINHCLEKLVNLGLVKECFCRVVGGQNERFFGLVDDNIALPIPFSEMKNNEKVSWMQDTIADYENKAIRQIDQDENELVFAEYTVELTKDKLNKVLSLIKELAAGFEELEKGEPESNTNDADKKQYRCLFLMVPAQND